MAKKRDEFSPQQIAAYFEYNAACVRRHWREDFADSCPHYICEECRFVSEYRGLFQLDHILSCEQGGTSDRVSPEDQRRMHAGDQELIHIIGLQGMVLCVGCNQAKKGHRQFVPPGSGYAYRWPERDRNPDHLGGPPPITRRQIEQYPEGPGAWLDKPWFKKYRR